MKAPHVFATLAFALLGTATSQAGNLPVKPNILFLVADDLGWADVGWHGSRLKTPNLDRLVKEGVELDRHYVQPVCTPTRTALMTGRWTSRTGPHVLNPSNLRAFKPGTVTLAVALKQAGYYTCLSGKWHLGSRPEWGPNHFGFDQSYGSMAGAVDPWEHTYRPGEYLQSWHRNGQFVKEEGNATELVAKQAAIWIREQRQPWFIYVPFQAVHIPVDAPDEYRRLYDAEAKAETNPDKADALRRYGGFVSQMDAKVGELVAALEQTGQRANTLVVFTSDNGGTPALGNPYAGKTAPLKTVVSSNLPLRGNKGQLYEGGVRVAAFANWPGRLAPRKVSAPLHVADWMPTLTRLAGWTAPPDLKFDGLDIWPLLIGATPQPEPRTIYIPLPGAAAVYQGDWKLIVKQTGANARKKGKAGPAPELYNLIKDPLEQEDLAAQEPDRVKALLEKYAELRRDDVTERPEDLKNAKP